MTEKLANRAEINSGHHESRRKGMPVAMPRIIDDPRVFQRGLEAVTMTAQAALDNKGRKGR